MNSYRTLTDRERFQIWQREEKAKALRRKNSIANKGLAKLEQAIKEQNKPKQLSFGF